MRDYWRCIVFLKGYFISFHSICFHFIGVDFNHQPSKLSSKVLKVQFAARIEPVFVYLWLDVLPCCWAANLIHVPLSRCSPLPGLPGGLRVLQHQTAEQRGDWLEGAGQQTSASHFLSDQGRRVGRGPPPRTQSDRWAAPQPELMLSACDWGACRELLGPKPHLSCCVLVWLEMANLL